MPQETPQRIMPVDRRRTLAFLNRALNALIAAFLLLQVAAILRVVAGMTDNYRAVVIASGVVWILAFAVFLLRYAPMLLQPRVDGRPG